MSKDQDENIVWTNGLLTWVIGQDVVLADDVAARLFDLDENECRDGTRIETFLAQIVEADRQRIATQLYKSIAEGCDYVATFEVIAAGSRRKLIAKGKAVGDVLFTCIVAEFAGSAATSSLRDLCFAAYDAARRENNDRAAFQLMRTLVLVDAPDMSTNLH